MGQGRAQGGKPALQARHRVASRHCRPGTGWQAGIAGQAQGVKQMTQLHVQPQKHRLTVCSTQAHIHIHKQAHTHKHVCACLCNDQPINLAHFGCRNEKLGAGAYKRKQAGTQPDPPAGDAAPHSMLINTLLPPKIRRPGE